MAVNEEKKKKPAFSVEARRKQHRKITLIRKRSERELETLRNHVPDSKVLRSPRVLFGIIFILTLLGWALIRQTDRAAKGGEIWRPRAQRYVDTLATALAQYRYHTGQWPANDQGLRALVEDPGVEGWRGSYITRLPRDLWNEPYGYRAPNEALGETLPLVFSCGPDSRPFTGDDIVAAPGAFDLMAYDPEMNWTNSYEAAEKRRRKYLPGYGQEE